MNLWGEKAKMKLLLVCTVPTDKSGIPNVIFNILQGMDKNDMEIGYVSINNPSKIYSDKLKEYGIKLYVIHRKMTHPMKYVLELAKIARGYDIMHVHGNSATMLLEMTAARIGVVGVRAAHAHTTSCSMRWCDKICRPFFYAMCNCRFACSNAAAKWLFGNQESKIINNGIDTVKFQFNPGKRNLIRDKYGIEENTLIVGHVGNFVEAKNHDFLIDVFKAISKSVPKSKLLLLGDGNLLDKFRTKVHNLELDDKVIFAGSVDNPEDYMSAMDVVIMPSLFEGLPLTLVEEQANGLRCVVADTITRDADMSGNLTFLSLDAPVSEWVSKTLKVVDECGEEKRQKRSEKAIEDIRNNGYDITQIGKDLKNYYIKRLDEIEKH